MGLVEGPRQDKPPIDNEGQPVQATTKNKIHGMNIKNGENSKIIAKVAQKISLIKQQHTTLSVNKNTSEIRKEKRISANNTADQFVSKRKELDTLGKSLTQSVEKLKKDLVIKKENSSSEQDKSELAEIIDDITAAQYLLNVSQSDNPYKNYEAYHTYSFTIGGIAIDNEYRVMCKKYAEAYQQMLSLKKSVQDKKRIAIKGS